mmetsp:Transcript_46422/g.92115  ORF Transcript_46422/g.92115 Transcript_46422/m.92115 type:complete len:498 (-) Transcript_46422:40-1533(-)
MAYLVVAAVTATLVTNIAAWRTSGTLPDSPHFANYVGKFCFDYGFEENVSENATRHREAKTVGLFSVDVHGYVEPNLTESEADPNNSPANGNLWLMVFSDQKHRWLRAREFWSDLSCHEKKEIASWYQPVKTDAGKLLWNQSVYIRQGIRPRFWYFTFVNCGAQVKEHLSYSLHAVNLEGGFQLEFGMDVKGSLPLEVTFCILFLLVATISCLLTMTRTARLSNLESGSATSRPLLKILQFSAGASAAGCGFRAWHHAIFAQDGQGQVELQVIGTLCACAAKAAFTVLQFLLARGWALIRNHTDMPLRGALFGVLLCVVGLAVGCEIYEQYFHDQSTSFFLYENWTGYSMLAMNLGLLASAWWFTWVTLNLETSPTVRRFYYLVSAAAGVYFAALPMVALLASTLSPWVRRKYVERVELSARWLATVLLLVALRPSQLDTLVAARLKNRQQPSLLPAAGIAGEEEMELQETATMGGAMGGGLGEASSDTPYALEKSS